MSNVQAAESHITIYGERDDHTLDADGNFKHPFDHQPAHVQTIHYVDSSTFSVKLSKVAGPSKHEHILAQPYRPKPSLWERLKEQLSSLLLGADYNVPLINYYNYYYYGQVYMGSEKKEISAVWDTGSDWYVLEVYDCAGCDGSTYDYRDSDDFEWTQPIEYPDVTYSDGAYVQGMAAYDTVCIHRSEEESCAESFKWLAITYTNGKFASTFDGVIGMWSGNNGNMDS